MAITGFLSDHGFTDRELAAALLVLLKFKDCESEEELLGIPFMAWTKLEQLEEFLQHLVHGTPLNDDTLIYIRSLSAERN